MKKENVENLPMIELAEILVENVEDFSGIDPQEIATGWDRCDLMSELEDAGLFSEKDENEENSKKKEIVSVLIDIFDRINIDTPSNFDEIAEFCYNDVCETADPINWNDSDVAIAFRRFIEKIGE
jgi:hypothetical protein